MRGTNTGVGGRSRNASVCVELSASGSTSVSSSRYASVWMSVCLRPSTGSGVAGGFIFSVARLVEAGLEGASVGSAGTMRAA